MSQFHGHVRAPAVRLLCLTGFFGNPHNAKQQTHLTFAKLNQESPSNRVYTQTHSPISRQVAFISTRTDRNNNTQRTWICFFFWWLVRLPFGTWRNKRTPQPNTPTPIRVFERIENAGSHLLINIHYVHCTYISAEGLLWCASIRLFVSIFGPDTSVLQIACPGASHSPAHSHAKRVHMWVRASAFDDLMLF